MPAAANAAARTHLPLELKLDALLARLDRQLVAALQIHQLEDVLDDVVCLEVGAKGLIDAPPPRCWTGASPVPGPCRAAGCTTAKSPV